MKVRTLRTVTLICAALVMGLAFFTADGVAAVVFSLVHHVIDRASRVSEECDLMLAVGSTLSVYPVAGCVLARKGSPPPTSTIPRRPAETTRVTKV